MSRKKFPDIAVGKSLSEKTTDHLVAITAPRPALGGPEMCFEGRLKAIRVVRLIPIDRCLCRRAVDTLLGESGQQAAPARSLPMHFGADPGVGKALIALVATLSEPLDREGARRRSEALPAEFAFQLDGAVFTTREDRRRSSDNEGLLTAVDEILENPEAGETALEEADRPALARFAVSVVVAGLAGDVAGVTGVHGVELPAGLALTGVAHAGGPPFPLPESVIDVKTKEANPVGRGAVGVAGGRNEVGRTPGGIAVGAVSAQGIPPGKNGNARSDGRVRANRIDLDRIIRRNVLSAWRTGTCGAHHADRIFSAQPSGDRG